MGHVEIADMLLKQDPKQIQDSCDQGKTALHYAVALDRARSRHESIAQPLVALLLERGALVNALDKRGQTPIDDSHGTGTTDLLKKHGGESGYRLRKPR
jgi:ankyrin repeat protein